MNIADGVCCLLPPTADQIISAAAASVGCKNLEVLMISQAGKEGRKAGRQAGRLSSVHVYLYRRRGPTHNQPTPDLNDGGILVGPRDRLSACCRWSCWS